METETAATQIDDFSEDSHSQRQAPPDENALLNINDEEQIFYEKFKDGINNIWL